MFDMDFSDKTEKHVRHVKTLDAVRWISALVEANGGAAKAAEIFAQRWPHSAHTALVQQRGALRLKAVVPAGTEGSGSWAEPLMAPTLGTALIEFYKPFSVVARLGLQRVPFQTFVPVETAAVSTAGWVGPGRAKVVIRGTLDRTYLSLMTVAAILVLTRELVRLSSEASAVFLRNRIGRGIAAFIDQQFVDPSVAAVTDLNPASVTNGLTPVASAGQTAENAVTDAQNLVAEFVANGGHLETATFLLSTTNSVALRLSGHDAFKDLTRDGGMLGGIPTLASDGISHNFVLLDTQRVLLADDGVVDFDLAEQASLEMSDSPTSPSTNQVSLFQTNSVALRAKRIINWQALENAAAYIADADYLIGGSPVGSP